MGFRTITKKFIPRETFRKIEPAGHTAEALLTNIKNGFPAKGVKFIGVTGTNGKTSTAFMIHRMLTEAGYKVGLMTTVAYGVGNDIKPQMEHMTTLSVGLLHSRIKDMKAKGAEWIVLEVTSHALAQGRTLGIPFEIAVMTNLTHEHLDYHGTFDKYLAAKRKLFEQTNKNHNGLRIGVVNADDPNAEAFTKAIANPVTYGLNRGDLVAKNVELSPAGSKYKVGELSISCNLPGSFNVSNSLAAVAVGKSLKLTNQQIEQGIAALKTVEGRMARIDEGQDFDVIVDYAHTPDSFEKLFKDLREMIGPSRASHLSTVQGSKEERANSTKGTESERQTQSDAAMRQEPGHVAGFAGQQGKAVRSSGKLIAVFGSAGRRDEAKRAEQGKIAGKYADEIVITEEDDRDIDGMEIMNQIAGGAETSGKTTDKDMFLVHDRPEAIQFAINRAEKGDTVILLGKGHEKDILRNGPKAAEMRHLQQDDHNPDRVIEVPWDESEEAKKALKNVARA